MMMMMMMNLGYRVGDDCDEFRRMRNEKLPQKTLKDGQKLSRTERPMHGEAEDI